MCPGLKKNSKSRTRDCLNCSGSLNASLLNQSREEKSHLETGMRLRSIPNRSRGSSPKGLAVQIGPSSRRIFPAREQDGIRINASAELPRILRRRLVALGRVELPTFGLGNRCSIHLSYRATE
jgi:hypothetical protein